VVNFTPWPLYLRGRSPSSGTHWIGGSVDPRTGLDHTEKWKFLTIPGVELRPFGRPARIQSLYRLRYPGSLKNMVHLYISTNSTDKLFSLCV
jgi:hypothetical protein